MTVIRPVSLVTGANSGVGLETTRCLAEAGWKVIMACRSGERGHRALDHVAAGVGASRLELELADLAELTEVVGLADRVAARYPELHGLVLNAGLFSQSLERTAEGFELTMGVNHLAHVLLTARLYPELDRAGGRVVAVSSNAHRNARPHRAAPDAIFDGRAWDGGLRAYGDSKLANALFALELDRRARACGVRADAVHPGVLATRIWDNARGVLGVVARIVRLFMTDPSAGGEVVARPVLESDPGEGGRYLDRRNPGEPTPDVRDPELAARWWDASLEALGVTIPLLDRRPDGPARRSRPSSDAPG